MVIATSPVAVGRVARTSTVRGWVGSLSTGRAKRLISFITGASGSASRLSIWTRSPVGCQRMSPCTTVGRSKVPVFFQSVPRCDRTPCDITISAAPPAPMLPTARVKSRWPRRFWPAVGVSMTPARRCRKSPSPGGIGTFAPVRAFEASVIVTPASVSAPIARRSLHVAGVKVSRSTPPPAEMRPRPMARVRAVRRMPSRITPEDSVARLMIGGRTLVSGTGAARSKPLKPVTWAAMSASEMPRVGAGSLCRTSSAPVIRALGETATNTSSALPEYPTDPAISQVEPISPTTRPP